VPQIIILPHEVLCPDGMVIEAESGMTICDAALQNHIEILVMFIFVKAWTL